MRYLFFQRLSDKYNADSRLPVIAYLLLLFALPFTRNSPPKGQAVSGDSLIEIYPLRGD